MYLPKHFAETRPDVLHAAMHEHPLVTLVTLSARGVEANNIPLLLNEGVLQGHVARANPLWREHPNDADVLAVFNGAQAYVSPNWYPSKRENGKAVPTWNYITVQARGRLRIIDDRAWVRALVERLTAIHEAPQPAPWRIDDAPPDYIDAMLGAIVGIEITITELTGKWKISQNQSAANQAGVIAGLSQQHNATAQAMAEVMAEKMAAHRKPDTSPNP